MRSIKHELFIFFVWGGLFFCVPLFAEETKTGTKSFFDFSGFSYEKQLAETYQQKHLLSLKYHSQLRRLVAQKVAFDHLEEIRKEWGEPTDEFPQWLEEHSELLETFLTAVDLQYDDFSAALRIFKELGTSYPQRVEKYPDLAVAVAVTWDQPNAFSGNSRGQFQATEAPDPASSKEIFLYYSDDTMPFSTRVKLLPWEFLTHVVANITSAEQRRWALNKYGADIKMLGKAYNDVDWADGDPPPLAGKPYTLTNMRQYGGVCTCRADFSLALCRSLAVPAFYGGAGWPKYYGGHSWVMWLEIYDIAPNRVSYTFEQEGRYSDGKYYIAGYTDPQTVQDENDGVILLRCHRVGSNTIAYRHSELLMRCYQSLVNATALTMPLQLKLLLDIDTISPGSLKAWKQIVAFGKNGQFNKKDISNVERLYHRMLSEFAISPNYLPALAAGLLDFPEIKGLRPRLYAELFDLLNAKNRPDLVFETVINFSQSQLNDGDHKKAFEYLASVCAKHYEEASRIEPVLAQLEKAADRDFGKTRKKEVGFYQDFLTLVLKNDGLPEDYKLDMLRRAQTCFERHKAKELTEQTKQVIWEKEEARKNKT